MITPASALIFTPKVGRLDLPTLLKNPAETALWNRFLGDMGSRAEGSFFEPVRVYGVEIGCLYGDSAETILQAHPSIHLTSIDPHSMNNLQ